MNGVEPTRNLLILEETAIQDPSDWIAIKQRIDRDAPYIEVRIGNVRHPNSVTARWQVRRPPSILTDVLIQVCPSRRRCIFWSFLGKDEQRRRLSSIGSRTPRTEKLSSVSSFDPKEWGEYVVVKPNNWNGGIYVRLVRTTDVSAHYEELIALVRDRFLVQPFIDHSEDGYPTHYRVSTMFGRALYCVRRRWSNMRPPLAPLAEIAANPLGVIASNSEQMGDPLLSICNDSETISLGERAHEAFPECGVLGADIIRERQSGRFYVLEVNSHGTVSAFANVMPNSMRWIAPPTC
jgi:hypothetical protein